MSVPHYPENLFSRGAIGVMNADCGSDTNHS